MSLSPDDPALVGRYRIEERLGSGGMGTVYLARDDGGRRVAVKTVRPELALDAAFRARFAGELVNARRVASFCTAKVLDHGEWDGRPYMVTEYIEGPSLADFVTAGGPFPAASLRSLAVGIATALTAIHAVRLVHRDLKPTNVLLSATGPRVIDFGIARALDDPQHHTQTGLVVGSPGWIAPEQIFDGVTSPAGDIFAWGSLVAYAATGRHPYGTGNMLVLAARAQRGEHDLTGVPGDLLPLVTSALAAEPGRRPAAEDLLIALVGAQDPETAAGTVLDREWNPNVLTVSTSAQPAGTAPTPPISPSPTSLAPPVTPPPTSLAPPVTPPPTSFAPPVTPPTGVAPPAAPPTGLAPPVVPPAGAAPHFHPPGPGTPVGGSPVDARGEARERARIAVVSAAGVLALLVTLVTVAVSTSSAVRANYDVVPPELRGTWTESAAYYTDGGRSTQPFTLEATLHGGGRGPTPRPVSVGRLTLTAGDDSCTVQLVASAGSDGRTLRLNANGAQPTPATTGLQQLCGLVFVVNLYAHRRIEAAGRRQSYHVSFTLLAGDRNRDDDLWKALSALVRRRS